MLSTSATTPGGFTRLPRIGEIDLDSFRFFCLLLAVAAYAGFGSPTPDNPGWPEIIVGVLLVFAAGWTAFSSALIPDSRAPFWRGAGSLALAYGLLIMLPLSAMRGNDPKLIMRDVIPFLFMLMPLFAADIFERRADRFKVLLFAFSGAGLLFSLRGISQAEGSFLIKGGELFYFANSPSVLFAALWLIGASFSRFARRPDGRRLFFAAAAALLAALPVFAMSLSLQRAGVGAVAIYVALLAASGLWNYPFRVAFLIASALALTFPLWPDIAQSFHELSRKTALHGFNMRGQEMAAVWREVSADPLTMLLGKGWGGGFESPAVAGIRVNYTHSLVSSMLLKAGGAGLLLVSAYLTGLGRGLVIKSTKAPALGLALMAPFLIGVFLYASYKSLDFGLLLLLIAAFELSFRAGYRIPDVEN